MKFPLCAAIAVVMSFVHACASPTFAAPPSGYPTSVPGISITGPSGYAWSSGELLWSDADNGYETAGQQAGTTADGGFLSPDGGDQWVASYQGPVYYGSTTADFTWTAGLSLPTSGVLFGDYTISDGATAAGVAVSFQEVPEPAALGFLMPALSMLLLRRGFRRTSTESSRSVLQSSACSSVSPG